MFVLLFTPAGKLLRAKTCCVFVRLATTSLLLILVGLRLLLSVLYTILQCLIYLLLFTHCNTYLVGLLVLFALPRRHRRLEGARRRRDTARAFTFTALTSAFTKPPPPDNSNSQPPEFGIVAAVNLLTQWQVSSGSS